MNKGSILIATLIIISIAASFALTINNLSIIKVSNIQKLHDDYQAAIYATNTIKFLKELLRHQDDIITPNSKIFNIPQIPIEKGLIKISINPINAKINLNLLKLGVNATRTRILSALYLVVEQNDLPDNYIEPLLKWIGFQDSNNETFSTTWSYNAKYKNKQLDTLYELKYIPFCGTKLFNILKNNFTVIGNSPKININFATAQTLRLYLPEIAQYVPDIIKYRKESPFVDVSMIRNICRIPDKTYLKILPFITVNANFFYVKILVKINNRHYYFHYIIEKNAGYIKILRYIESGNYDYF